MLTMLLKFRYAYLSYLNVGNTYMSYLNCKIAVASLHDLKTIKMAATLSGLNFNGTIFAMQVKI